MAVKASVTITISKYRDTDSITRYYKLQASTAAAPAVPTTLTPSGWSTSEPTYTSGSTNTLYYTDCVVFSDGTFQYTDDGNGKAVKSSSYEAAKEAYNKAQAAQNTADTTQENLDNLNIGGRNLFKLSNTFTSGGTGASGITPSIENGLWKIVVASGNSKWLSWDHSNIIEANINDNEEFVFSFDIKSADANKTKPPRIYFKRGLGYFQCLGTVGAEWTRCYYIGQWKKANTIGFHFGWEDLAGTYYIRRLKFEKGNKPTDWTPAPEDIDDAIAKTVKTVDVEYYLSTSSSERTGGSWSTTAPAWVDGKYMWSRQKVTFVDNTTSTTNTTCIAGAKGSTGTTGTGIDSITEEYYLSTSKTIRTGGSWVTTPPTWESGKYIWTRSKIVYKNPASTAYTTPLCSSEWEAVNELEIGGRNLILNSKEEVHSILYPIKEYTLSEDWIDNNEYTLSLKGTVENGNFGIWRNTNSEPITSKMNYDAKKDIYWHTFKCPSTGPMNKISIFNPPSIGKNLFDYTKYLNLAINYEYVDSSYHCKAIPLKPNTQYTVSFPTKEKTTSIILLINKDSHVNGHGFLDTRLTRDVKTFTTNDSGNLYIGTTCGNNETVNALLESLHLQIEEGATATSYEPYMVHNSTIEWIKLEKGNKYTDWSPAPEDIDENIETVSAYAQNVANELLTTKGQLTAASTRIDSLQGIIENFVKDDNGMVTVTQTGSGMQIDMTQATNRINQLLTAIQDAVTEGEASQLRTELLTAIQAVQSRTAYINATQDAQGRPVITLGATDSPFKVEITNEAINFIQNGQIIAYANGQKFYNLRTVVQQDVQIGIGPGFIWKTRDSGNMGLTWIPAQS